MSSKNDDLKAMQERVKKSRQLKQQIVERFGFMPHSVIELHRGHLSRQMFIYQQEKRTRGGTMTKRMSGKGKESRLKLGVLGGVLGGNTNTMMATIMPAELVEFFIKYYCKPGDVYLDPFVGQGIQMQVAKMYGLNYLGYDISEEFMSYVEAIREKIHDGKTRIELTTGDSKHPDNIPNGIGDFCFTSPPYWDTEFYGDEIEQLGYNHTYEEFLEGMEDVARAWFPKFKKGATLVINVNDFRRQGTFYPYHMDTIELFRKAGYIMRDLWIIKGLVGGLPKAFAVEFNLKQIAPKVHEYALVFTKE